MSIKGKIIGAVVVVAALFFIGTHIYNTGYDNGVLYVNSQVAEQKAQWEQQIRDLQISHDVQLATLTQKHNDEVQSLNKQIETLKQHPTIITKYVTDNRISNGVALIHDRSVNRVPLSMMIPDNVNVNESSNYTEADLANTIAINYNRCNVCIDRLTTLQQIIRQYQQKQTEAIKQ